MYSMKLGDVAGGRRGLVDVKAQRDKREMNRCNDVNPIGFLRK